MCLVIYHIASVCQLKGKWIVISANKHGIRMVIWSYRCIMYNRVEHILIYISDGVDIETWYPMQQYKVHHTNVTPIDLFILWAVHHFLPVFVTLSHKVFNSVTEFLPCKFNCIFPFPACNVICAFWFDLLLKYIHIHIVYLVS